MRTLALFVCCLLTSLGMTQTRGKVPSPAALAVPPASSGCQPPSAELRGLARRLRAQHPSDTGAFLHALDREIGAEYMDTIVEGRILFAASDDLDVMITPRYAAYRFGLKEAIRKMDPLDDVPIIDGVTISVGPDKMTAPDIIKIVVTRNGEVVAPTTSTLEPTTLTNAFGSHVVLHRGAVLFPCSAFAPGAIVVVTAIPDSGSNFSHQLSLGDLRNMR